MEIRGIANNLLPPLLTLLVWQKRNSTVGIESCLENDLQASPTGGWERYGTPYRDGEPLGAIPEGARLHAHYVLHLVGVSKGQLLANTHVPPVPVAELQCKKHQELQVATLVKCDIVVATVLI